MISCVSDFVKDLTNLHEYGNVIFQMEFEKIQSEKLTKSLTDKRSRRQRKVMFCLSRALLS